MNQGERQMRLAELLNEAEAEEVSNPHQAKRTLLTAAGYHVGFGDWEAAKKIYDDLAANSAYPEVKATAIRNIEVVDRNLALQKETDTNRREWLELKLAVLHRDLGHEQAARRIWRDLEKTAKQEAVRTQAAGHLSRNTPPTRPPRMGGEPQHK